MRWSSLAVILLLAIAWLPSVPFSYSDVYQPYSDAELDQLLAPIALYPDPLLAQILPAASFGDQIYRASSLLDGHVDEGLIEIQPWDISVKALAHYPNILTFMAQSPDWTAAVGQAYVIQRRAVERSIQRLRDQARAAGYLQSTEEQQVISDDNAIRIEPAQADVIYVPQYDPGYIWGYSDLYPAYPYPAFSYGGLAFGTGLFIGPWLNRDWDWFGAGPYYHGWRGKGWVGRSRQFVDTQNRSYVNDQFRNVHVNRDVVNRNTGDIRVRMDRNAGVRGKPQVNPQAPGATPPSQVVIPPPAEAVAPRPAPREVTPPPPAAAAPTPAPREVTPPPATATPPAPRVTPPPAKAAPPSPRVTPPPAAAPPPAPRVTPPPATAAPPSPRVTPPPATAAPPAPRVTPPPAAAPPPAPRVTPPPAAAPPPAPRVTPPPATVPPPSPRVAPPPPPAAMPAPRPVTPPPPAVTPAPRAVPPAAPPPHAAPPPVAPPHPAPPPAPPPHAAAPPAPPSHPAAPPPPPSGGAPKH